MKKKYSINIAAYFGSKFQEESALRALETMLQTWASFYNGTHKKNEITVWIETENTSVRVKERGLKMEQEFTKMMEDQGIKFVDL